MHFLENSSFPFHYLQPLTSKTFALGDQKRLFLNKTLLFNLLHRSATPRKAGRDWIMCVDAGMHGCSLSACRSNQATEKCENKNSVCLVLFHQLIKKKYEKSNITKTQHEIFLMLHQTENLVLKVFSFNKTLC